MLRFVFFCSFLLAGINAFAQKVDTLRRKDAADWEFIQVRNNNAVTMEGNRHKGIMEGVWTDYWDNGYPHYVTTYIAGTRDGLHLEMTRNGIIELLENYKNGLLEGPRRTYSNGYAVSEEVYYSEGKKNGNYMIRYASGQKKESGTYNNDHYDGQVTWYYENGQKAAEYNYRQGIIDGNVTTYFDNGKVETFGLYTNNEQTGTWKEYYRSGARKEEGKYLKGKKEGAWLQWDESGKPGKNINYKKGTAK